MSKRFGGADALKDVSLDVLQGEIHCLLGQNGSGKSTLIKILSGYHEPDAGELAVGGRPIPFPLRSGQARKIGMTFVYQDLGLVESLSVLDNLRVGRYESNHLRPISWRKERRLVRQAGERFGLRIDPDTKVAVLRDIERAGVAIVRALLDLERHEGGLLVLDEPTVYLPRDGVERLFQIVREVAADGNGVLFVTHQLAEVQALSDRVTVLRNAQAVATVRTADVDEDELIALILGRGLGDLYPEPGAAAGSETALSIEALSGIGIHEASFDIRVGEILGLTGLVGMGYEDVPYMLVGAKRADHGQLSIQGKIMLASQMTPVEAIRSGIALVPAHRLRDALVGSLSVQANVSLPVLDRYFRRFRMRHGEERAAVYRLLETFDVRPSDPAGTAATLSGGNQQKAVLAKWLQTAPTALVMHEPTQGVDIGARKQIFQLVREVADSGQACWL